MLCRRFQAVYNIGSHLPFILFYSQEQIAKGDCSIGESNKVIFLEETRMEVDATPCRHSTVNK